MNITDMFVVYVLDSYKLIVEYETLMGPHFIIQNITERYFRFPGHFEVIDVSKLDTLK